MGREGARSRVSFESESGMWKDGSSASDVDLASVLTSLQFSCPSPSTLTWNGRAPQRTPVRRCWVCAHVHRNRRDVHEVCKLPRYNTHATFTNHVFRSTTRTFPLESKVGLGVFKPPHSCGRTRARTMYTSTHERTCIWSRTCGREAIVIGRCRARRCSSGK